MLLLACTGSTILTARSSSFSFFSSHHFYFFYISTQLTFHSIPSILLQTPHPCRASLAGIFLRYELEKRLRSVYPILRPLSVTFLFRNSENMWISQSSWLVYPLPNIVTCTIVTLQFPACPSQPKNANWRFVLRQGIFDKKIHNLMILHVGIKSNLQNWDLC